MGQDRGPIDLEKRPDDTAAADRNARETARPRALENPHEDGLDLVVRGVAQRDAAGPRLAGDARERGVADPSGRLLGGQPDAKGHAHPADACGAPQSRRQRLDEVGIPVGFRPEPVVHVADGDLKAVPRTQEDERVEQGDRVGATRDAYEDVVSRIEESPPDDGVAHRGGEERRLAARLLRIIGHRRRSSPAAVTRPAGRPRRSHPRTAPASRSGRSA